jgi:hypothetical protein
MSVGMYYAARCTQAGFNLTTLCRYMPMVNFKQVMQRMSLYIQNQADTVNVLVVKQM